MLLPVTINVYIVIKIATGNIALNINTLTVRFYQHVQNNWLRAERDRTLFW